MEEARSQKSPWVQFAVVALVVGIPVILAMSPDVGFIMVMSVAIFIMASLLPWIIAHFRRHERRRTILWLSIGLAGISLGLTLQAVDQALLTPVFFQPSVQLQMMNVVLFIAYLGLLGWAIIGKPDSA